jgi:hypothetical protein
MGLEDLLAALGLKLSVLVAGLGGGVLRSLSRRRYSLRERLASPICGALCAAYLTPGVTTVLLTLHFPMVNQSEVTQNAVAFLVGICGMNIADWVFYAAAKYMRDGQ